MVEDVEGKTRARVASGCVQPAGSQERDVLTE